MEGRVEAEGGIENQRGERRKRRRWHGNRRRRLLQSKETGEIIPEQHRSESAEQVMHPLRLLHRRARDLRFGARTSTFCPQTLELIGCLFIIDTL